MMLAEARDQAAHMLAGALVMAPVALHPAWWTLVLSGALCGLVRETAQHDTLKPWELGKGSWLDIGTGWVASGILLALIRGG